MRFARIHRQRHASSLSNRAGLSAEPLERRAMFNAAPVAPAFTGDLFGQPPGTWPRLAEHATYDGQAPTFTVSYDQLLALTRATDADGDTIRFLYLQTARYNTSPYQQSWPDELKFGVLGEDGQPLAFIDSTASTGPGSEFDPNGDGIPDGPYVLEPGETWTWRGYANMAFSGYDSISQAPYGNTAPDTSLRIEITDTIRPWAQTADGFVLLSGNQSPRTTVIGAVPQEPPFYINLGHKGTAVWTFEQIESAVKSIWSISDHEGDEYVFVISPGYSYLSATSGMSYAGDVLHAGDLTVGGTSLASLSDGTGYVTLPGIWELTADSPLVLQPGETVTYTNTRRLDATVFTVSLWDGLSEPGPLGYNGAYFSVSARANTPPSAPTVVDLGALDTSRHASWTYEQLSAMIGATDDDGDALTLMYSNALNAGSLKVNGVPIAYNTYPTIGPGDVVEFSSPGYIPDQTGFALVVSDGWGSATTRLRFSSAAFAVGGDLGDLAIVPGGAMSAASSAYYYQAHGAAWRNAAGELVLSTENLEHYWSTGAVVRTSYNLSTLYGLPVLTGDPVLANDQNGLAIYAPTAHGLVMVTYNRVNYTGYGNTSDDPDPFYIRNLSDLNPGVPVTDLSLVTLTGGSWYYTGPFPGLAGRNADGEFVLLSSTDDTSANAVIPTTFNVSGALANQGQTAPEFSGRLISYSQRWGGMNIVGLDAAGDLWGIWTGNYYNSGGEGYRQWWVTNLSQITGAGKLTGDLSVYSTSWDATNIFGTNQDGDLVVTWWAPALGPGKWQSHDFTQLFNGAKLDSHSLAGWATSWGSLNIVGTDGQGRLSVYWWNTASIDDANPYGWRFERLGQATFQVGGRLAADTTDYYSTPRMQVYGVDGQDGTVRFTYWEPSFGTTWADASA